MGTGRGALSPGIYLPGLQAYYSPPSSVEVKNARRYTSIPQYVLMVLFLIMYEEKFTFYFNKGKKAITG
jgi:hypothetical protein